ncbi:MAG: BON domain-containing protein [Gammaproteobacteria bacterium]|nr:BON domain-containing protein [Gammaproteobacteria bacterium]
MRHRFPIVVSLLTAVTALAGCIEAALVGGAATGAVVATDTRTTGAFIDDEGIELKSGSAISNDESLKDVHINVTSINGVVLLTGEAPTEAQRTKILEHVRTVPRVRRTVNEIRVSPATAYSSRMSDTLITTKVKSKMLGDEKLDSLRIKVVTEYGVVYLMGLAKKEEAERAAELTRQVGGVQKVVKLFEYTD